MSEQLAPKLVEAVANQLKLHEIQIVNVGAYDEAERKRRWKVREETACIILRLVQQHGKVETPPSDVESVAKEIQKFIKTMWVELMEDAPDVAYKQNDLDNCVRSILELLPEMGYEKQEIEGWADVTDRFTYFDEKEDDIDEVVMVGANVHMESMSDQSIHLIMENSKHRWNFVIHTISSRSKLKIMLQDADYLRTSKGE